MGNINKKIQAQVDKKYLLSRTGKIPKHRCSVCHRFTLFMASSNGASKNCYWCLEEAQSKLKNKAEMIAKLNKEEK